MTNNKIQILPEFLANQIAAGEVVQRPESVIKELIENSLDAGATEIAIFIKEAGKTLIQIIDNGCGMSKDDLLLVPIRHATSKIYTQDDLEGIKTFGFRGEAIPSISAVSLLEIKTKQSDNKTGWKLISEPMKEIKVEEIAMDKGTQVSVKNLFYNVPARRKFLKSNITEQKYINETILKFALAHTNVRFIYYNNDLIVFDVKPQSLRERIFTLLEFDTAELDAPILPVEYSMNDIYISGYIGHPQLAKKTNSIQYFFLNGRSINSKVLSFAVFNGMEHLLEKGLKPLFVLNINLDYKSVDVNVHPQKSEVKFEDEQLIYSIIKKAVQNSLQLNKVMPELSNNRGFDKITISNENGKNENVIVNKSTGEIYSNVKYERFVSKLYEPSVSNYNKNVSDQSFVKYDSQLQKSVDLLYSSQNVSEQTQTETIQPDVSLNIKDFMLENLWQYHNKYILLQTDTGLLAIDQHNAHERAIYERLLANVESKIPSKQGLLFDVPISLNSIQMLTIIGIEMELKSLGFDFEIGENKVIINSQPSGISIGSIETAFTDIIDDYNSNEELKHIPNQERIIATIACKAAIKAGQKLEQEEMKSIVSNLLKCKMQYVCPHGRPIIVFFQLTDWDRKFGRI
jgi:DNA mismatch repair protein MutL